MNFKKNNIYKFHGDKGDELVIVTSTKDDVIQAFEISDGSKIECTLKELSPASYEIQVLYAYMLRELEKQDKYIDKLIDERDGTGAEL
jgi:hypothetical protein